MESLLEKFVCGVLFAGLITLFVIKEYAACHFPAHHWLNRWLNARSDGDGGSYFGGEGAGGSCGDGGD